MASLSSGTGWGGMDLTEPFLNRLFAPAYLDDNLGGGIKGVIVLELAYDIVEGGLGRDADELPPSSVAFSSTLDNRVGRILSIGGSSYSDDWELLALILGLGEVLPLVNGNRDGCWRYGDRPLARTVAIPSPPTLGALVTLSKSVDESI